MYQGQKQTSQKQKNLGSSLLGLIRGFFASIWRNITEKPEEIALGRKHRPATSIIAIVVALSLFGLIMAVSISPALSAEYSVLRQALFLIGGLVVFFVAARFVNFNWLIRASFLVFLITLILCVVPPVLGAAGIIEDSNGAFRWLPIGSLTTVQPSEFLKFGLMIFVASFLMKANRNGEINVVSKTLLPIIFFTLLALFVVVVLQKDLGSGAALAAIVFIQLIISGIQKKQIIAVVVALGLLGGLATVTSTHRMERIETFFSDYQCAVQDEDETFHICRVLIALGSGGLFGKGIGQSVGAFGWAPENTSDSIIAIVGESVGFAGIMAVLIGFAILLFRIIKMVDYTENLFLRLFLAGAFGWIFAHLTINIASMTGIIPLTGITLPFLSFGGTSIVATMTTIGVVFAISRYTSHSKINNNQETKDENSMRWRGIGRTRYASSSRH